MLLLVVVMMKMRDIVILLDDDVEENNDLLPDLTTWRWPASSLGRKGKHMYFT